MTKIIIISLKIVFKDENGKLKTQFQQLEVGNVEPLPLGDDFPCEFIELDFVRYGEQILNTELEFVCVGDAGTCVEVLRKDAATPKRIYTPNVNLIYIKLNLSQVYIGGGGI